MISLLDRSNFRILLIGRHTGSLIFCIWGRGEKLLIYNETNFSVRGILVGKLLF